MFALMFVAALALVVFAGVKLTRREGRHSDGGDGYTPGWSDGGSSDSSDCSDSGGGDSDGGGGDGGGGGD